MPFPTPQEVGYAPPQLLSGFGGGYTSPGSQVIDYSGVDPSYYGALLGGGDGTPPPRNQTVLPQEFWPSEEVYNRTAEMMRARGIEPPPRGTLDDYATQQLGRALYEEGLRESASLFGTGSPGWAALVNMGGAALGGALGGGASAPNALSAAPAYAGPTTAAGLPTGAAAAAGGGLGTLSGAVPAVGASPGLAAGLGGAAAGGIDALTGVPSLPAGVGYVPGGIPAVTGAGFGATTAATPLAAMPAFGGASAALGGVGAGGAAAGNWLDRFLPYISSGASALLGARAADRATDAETAALQQAIEEQRRQYDLNRQDLMPWLTAGQGALSNLQNSGTAFQASPGYDWRRSEGQRDIGNSFAARGGAASGNALRALSEFNQGLAAGEFNNWWNQQAGLAGVGQNTAVNLGSFGQNTAGNVGNALADIGLSRASGIINRYGALGQGLTDSLNWLQRRRLGG